MASQVTLKKFEKDGTLWWGIAAGLLFTAEFIMIYWGLEFTSASRAAIFINTAPFIASLGAQFFIPGEQLRLIQMVGLCSAFTGRLLLTLVLAGTGIYLANRPVPDQHGR